MSSFHVVDAILIPTPFYGVITEDLHLYSDVKLFHVPLYCEVGEQSLIHLVCRRRSKLYVGVDFISLLILFRISRMMTKAADPSASL